MNGSLVAGVAALAVLAGAAPSLAQPSPGAAAQAAPTGSELQDTVRRYTLDRGALLRRYDSEYSPTRRGRMRAFYDDWGARLGAIDFDTLSQETRIDYVLLDHEGRYERAMLDREERRFQEMEPWLPFASQIMGLQEAWRRMEPTDPSQVAATLASMASQVDSARERAAEVWRADSTSSPAQPARLTRVVARRAALLLGELQETLEDWHGFHAGYDPLFTWWTAAPYARADSALDKYLTFLREDVVGIRAGKPEPLIGDPIGADGLRADLAHQMIPYTPEELIAIADREFAWCEAEFRKAAREMGFGDDWKVALEKVKGSYVPPPSPVRGSRRTLTLSAKPLQTARSRPRAGDWRPAGLVRFGCVTHDELPSYLGWLSAQVG